MSLPNSMVIAMGDIEGELDKEAPVKERLKHAMKLARKHWLVTDEDAQFRAAVGAVVVTVSPEEKEIIMGELYFLKCLGAAVQGVPVNIVGIIMDRPKDAYGLRGLWNEVKMGEG